MVEYAGKAKAHTLLDVVDFQQNLHHSLLQHWRSETATVIAIESIGQTGPEDEAVMMETERIFPSISNHACRNV